MKNKAKKKLECISLRRILYNTNTNYKYTKMSTAFTKIFTATRMFSRKIGTRVGLVSEATSRTAQFSKIKENASIRAKLSCKT